MASASETPALNRPRHLTYWLRCLKTFLPNAYLSMDSNRTLLAAFTLAALDLLSGLEDAVSADERAGYVDWLYGCQLPTGGFRGSPSHSFQDHLNEQNAAWDPANVPATYFALSALIVLGDDLSRVKRRECLDWLRGLQQSDGSFVEILRENSPSEGKSDPRMAYCAMTIRWFLGGGLEGDIEDIRIDDLVRWLQTLETYDGGIGEGPFKEAHAGFTHCAISTLSLVDRLPDGLSNPLIQPYQGLGIPPQQPRQSDSPTAPRDLPRTLHWLVSRQTSYMDQNEPPADSLDASVILPNAAMGNAESQAQLRQALADPVNSQSLLSSLGNQDLCAGFNGRTNKLADTCYAFWAFGALHTLSQTSLPALPAARKYLLEQTQHIIGGFSKLRGDPPDIYHSYLGLATLALLGQDGLKKLDPVPCFSEDAKARVEAYWRRLRE